MNLREKSIIAKNALANVARGGTNALVAIALPPVLTRVLSAEVYGAWALVLQMSAYIGYFDFGLQTAVGRFVAHSSERGDNSHRDEIVSTSAAALAATGMISFVLLAILALLLPQIFHKMSPHLQRPARISLLFVAGSLAVGLPASVIYGIFVGLQRNEIAAFIIGGSRLLGGTVIAVIAWHHGGLIPMAIALATVNLLSYVIAYLAVRRLAPYVHFARSSIRVNAAKELSSYCYSLSIWSVAMLLVAGLDLTFVAIFQYSAVAYYAVATALVTFLSGLQNAIFSALMSPAAVLHARRDSAALGIMLIRSSRYGMLILLMTGLPLILFAKPILRLWVGQNYATLGSEYLVVLVFANVIRLVMTPYSVLLIGTGQQRMVILSPIAEGLSNLGASLVLGYWLGAIGVAYGTVFGAVVGVLLNFFYNMPRTSEIKFGMGNYLHNALLRPVAFVVPVGFVVGFLRLLKPGFSVSAISVLVAAALSVAIFWFHCLLPDERTSLTKPLVSSISSRACTHRDSQVFAEEKVR